MRRRGVGQRIGAVVSEHGRLERPAFFCLHVSIAVLVTIKIAAVVSQDTPFIVASKDTFTDMFLAGVTRKGNVGFIYEIDACLDSINRSIHTYYNLPAVGLDVYDALTTPIKIHAVALKENPREVLPRKRNTLVQDLDTKEVSVNVSSRDEGWMARLGIDSRSMSKKRSFFNSLVQLELEFQLRTLHRELDHVQLFDWQIRALYDFITRGGRIELSLQVEGSHVRLDKHLHWELELDVLLAIMAIGSQVAAQRAGHGLLYPRSVSGRWPERTSGGWGWDLLTLAGDACIGASVLLDFTDYWRLTSELRTLNVYVIGIACMLEWSGIIQHLETVHPYNMLILAMGRGVPVVARFLVGSIPLLMGFAGLGMALFSEHTEKFSSLENSAVTLFSVLNGDVLWDTARDIRPAGIIGDVFLVAFVCIFVYSGLNVFISIIQDAYMSAKEQISLPQTALASKGPLLPTSEDHHGHPDTKAAPVDLSVLSAQLHQMCQQLANMEGALQAALDRDPASRARREEPQTPPATKGGDKRFPMSGPASPDSPAAYNEAFDGLGPPLTPAVSPTSLAASRRVVSTGLTAGEIGPPPRGLAGAPGAGLLPSSFAKGGRKVV